MERSRLRERGARRSVAVLLIALTVLPGCGLMQLLRPAPDGLDRVSVDWSEGVNEIVVPPGGEFVVLRTSGPFGRFISYDSDLNRLDSDDIFGGCAAGSRPNEFLTWDNGIVAIRRLPEFTVVEHAQAPDDVFLYPWRFVRDDRAAGATRWLALVNLMDGKPQAIILAASDPLRFETPVRTRTRSVRGAALDRRTGTLVITGDDMAYEKRLARVEGFDIESMETVFELDLPVDRVSFDVAADAGTAWIGTDDGSGRFIEFDVASRAVRRVHETGVARQTALALSHDGTTLVVAAWRHVNLDRTDMRVILYDVSTSGAVERHRLDTVMPSSIQDVAVIPEWGVAIIASNPDAYAWHYARPIDR